MLLIIHTSVVISNKFISIPLIIHKLFPEQLFSDEVEFDISDHLKLCSFVQKFQNSEFVRKLLPFRFYWLSLDFELRIVILKSNTR